MKTKEMVVFSSVDINQLFNKESKNIKRSYLCNMNLKLLFFISFFVLVCKALEDDFEELETNKNKPNRIGRLFSRGRNALLKLYRNGRNIGKKVVGANLYFGRDILNGDFHLGNNYVHIRDKMFKDKTTSLEMLKSENEDIVDNSNSIENTIPLKMIEDTDDESGSGSEAEHVEVKSRSGCIQQIISPVDFGNCFRYEQNFLCKKKIC